MRKITFTEYYDVLRYFQLNPKFVDKEWEIYLRQVCENRRKVAQWIHVIVEARNE